MSLRPPSFRRALATPTTRRLMTAHATSSLAQQLVGVVLYSEVLRRHSGPGWVSVIATANTLPYVLFSSVGGALGDRFRKRSMLRSMYLLRALLFGVIAIMLVRHAPIGALVLTMAATHLLATPCYPTVASWMAQTTPISSLSSLTALMGLAGSGAYFLGPGIGGIATLAHAGVSAPLLAVALLGIAFASLQSTHEHEHAPLDVPGNTPVPTGNLIEASESSFGSLRLGALHIASSLSLIAVVAFVLIVDVVFGSIEVLSAVIARDSLHRPQALGTITLAVGAGAFLSMFFIKRAASSPRAGLLLGVMAVGCGLPLVVVAHSQTLWILAAGLAMSSAANLTAEILATTLIQHTVPDSVKGAVFGILDSIILGGLLTGGLLAPYLANSVQIGTVITILGVVTCVAGLVSAPLFVRISKRSQAQQAEVAEIVVTLRSLGVLAGASQLAVELLARHHEVEFPTPGAVIVREGDSPDDLFVLIEGTCSIDVLDADGHNVEVARITAPDTFGEIGLLQRVPRTATVMAMDQCTVWRIPGSRFLEAVSNGQLMTASSRQRMDLHLASHKIPRRRQH